MSTARSEMISMTEDAKGEGVAGRQEPEGDDDIDPYFSRRVGVDL